MDNSHMQSWMTLHSRRQIDLYDCREQDIDISDISWALARICRFNGHTSRFYSVACHCLGMAKYAIEMKLPTEVILKCLLHDAKEAYYGDITKPVQKLLGIKWEWSWEQSVAKAVAKRFFRHPDAVIDTRTVKELDDLFCLVEGYVLIGGHLWEAAHATASVSPENWARVEKIVKSFDYGQDFGRVVCEYSEAVRYWHHVWLKENSTFKVEELTNAEDTPETADSPQG